METPGSFFGYFLPTEFAKKWVLFLCASLAFSPFSLVIFVRCFRRVRVPNGVLPHIWDGLMVSSSMLLALQRCSLIPRFMAGVYARAEAAEGAAQALEGGLWLRFRPFAAQRCRPPGDLLLFFVLASYLLLQLPLPFQFAKLVQALPHHIKYF